jgi:16S rRNA (cytosine1402-N4)-methyltransferase
VKIFFRDNTFDAPDENPFATTDKPQLLKLVNKKPIVATAEELKRNPRSRSAKLRVARRP